MEDDDFEIETSKFWTISRKSFNIREGEIKT